jgi:hypothetical protein
MMSLADGVERARTLPARVGVVELAKVLRETSALVAAARLPQLPAASPGAQSVEVFTDWLQTVARDLAKGASHALS